MRRSVVLLPCALMVAATAGAVRAQATATPLVKIAITAPTHRPAVGEVWRYSVTVTNRSGRPLGGTIVPVVVDNGKRIDTVGWFALRRGHFQGSYKWRDIHAGRLLMFRARVRVTKTWRYKDFWIRVQP